MARPKEHTEKRADEFCSRIAMGASLRSVCAQEDMPSHQTIYRWLREYPEFSEQYVIAKQDRADFSAEKLHDLAEDALSGKYEPQQVRVAADIIKWTTGKHHSRVYGDKITTEHTGSVGVSDMTSEQLDQRIAAMLEAGADAG